MGIRNMRMNRIKSCVCECYGLTADRLCQLSRKDPLPRHIAMYMTHKLTDASLTQIARYYKRSDHTTVIHAVRKILNMMEDADFNEEMMQLEQKIRGACSSAERESYYTTD